MIYCKNMVLFLKITIGGNSMKYEDFKKALKDNGLTLTAFSELSGVKYDTASKWGKNGRPVSDWVESWIIHYEKSKRFDDAKKIFCDENK